MANVTDVVYRDMLVREGKPDVFWTEFVSCDGLLSNGRERLMPDLAFNETQRPIVAQFFTSKPDNMRECARMAKEMGFDGVDVNMGCPEKSIQKQGAGAACMKDPDNAVAVIEAAIEGADGLPISVKTRIGYNKDEIDTWIPVLLKTGIQALTIHLRTKKEMSKVPAHWERMSDIVELRNKLNPNILIIGNGDLLTKSHGREKVSDTGCDGVMIGRGLFHNYRLFSEKSSPTMEERVRAAIHHTQDFQKAFEGKKPFEIMKKHYKAYISGFPEASEKREQLFKANTYDEAISILQIFLK